MRMNPAVRKLVERGEQLFGAPQRVVRFTEDEDANKLLNDLSDHPHAFVLACIMDRQVKAERAWIAPYRLSQRLGSFRFGALARLSLNDIKRLMSKPDPLHRFVDI